MFPSRRFDVSLPYGVNAWKVYIPSHFSTNSNFVIMLPFVSGAIYVCMYVVVVVVCCCFSHSAHWLPTRKKLLYTVANPARGLLNRGKKKKKSGSAPPSPPPPPRARCSFGEKIKKLENKKLENHAAHPHVYALRKPALRRWSRSVSHPYKDSYDSSAPMGVASQNSTLPCAIATFPVSLPLSSPGDVWPRLPLLASTRP